MKFQKNCSTYFIFKSKRKKFNDKVKLSGKRIYPTASVKYFEFKTDQHLTQQNHINDLSVKPQS